MRTLILLTVLIAQGEPRNQAGRGATDKAREAEVEAALAADAKIDAATQMNEAAEAKRVLLSARMYSALKSVEAHRNGPQRKQLTDSERNLSNFDINVEPRGNDPWLRPEERTSHFVVTFIPRYLPGEQVLLDGPHRALGRIATYAVRKSDLQITRSKLED